MSCSHPTEQFEPRLHQLPSLIIVTGRPGSGKTTLAHKLARAVRSPAICRDEIKEGLVNALGNVQESFRDLQLEAYEAFFSVIQLLLKHRVTLIAEAAFQHNRWAEKLEPMKELSHIRMILCTIDAQLARERHTARNLGDPDRKRFHEDHTEQAREGHEFPIATYEPPRLDVPTLKVDTTDGYRPAFEEIVGFAVVNL